MAQIRDIEGVGKVFFDRSRRARRILITVAPVEGVRVSVPFGVSFDEAEGFVESKRGWIEKVLADFSEKERKLGPTLLKLPAVEMHLAKAALTGRLSELADLHGFLFTRVTVRNQKTLWGSCSAKNAISLNMKLITLTPDLIDYVLLHELLHTRIKNHSKTFWAELSNLTQRDAKELDKELRQYHLGLL